jgi:hypothetical protein
MTTSTGWGRIVPTPAGRRRLLLLLMVLTLLAAGCRGADNGGGSADSDEGGGDAATTAATDGDTEAAGGGEVATDVGVTEEACPNAVNEDNGCIYLGSLSDLTVGPFASQGPAIVEAQQAFWNRVNEEGGIGGAYDVDVESYVRDNQYNPEVQNQVYQEIKGDILALAQTLGSPTTAAILDDLKASDIVAAPGTWTSAWDFEEIVAESGAPYCVDAMNAVDWYAENNDGVESVIAIGPPGDFGEDGAAGAMIAAEANGATFEFIENAPGASLAGAIDTIVSDDPDLVFIAGTPAQLAEVAGGTTSRGYEGQFMGNAPTWDVSLLDSPVADVLTERYHQMAPWAQHDADTPSHEAMREALGDVEGNTAYVYGWGLSYPLRAVLEQAYSNGDLTRAGMVTAVGQVEEVDYEGLLPEGAGTFTGDPNDQVFRESVIHAPNPDSVSALEVTEDFYGGPTAADHQFEAPCFEAVDLSG